MKKHITLTMAALSAVMAAHAAGPDKNNIGITASKNYIHTRTYIQPVSMTAAADPANVARDDVAYYDGLGLLTHTVQVAASPDGKSIVLPVYRNAVFNEKEREYLPYSASTSNASAQTDPFAASNFSVYGSADSPYAFTLNEYENSPLGRVKRTYKPGSVYLSDKSRYVSYDYGVNSASEVLKLSFSSSTVSANGYYSAAELFRNTVTDEDGGQIVTFVDKQDKVIMERRKIADNNYADTYYVYDSSQRLVCVVPPEAAKYLNSGTGSLGDLTVNDLCYTYAYIGDRVVSKRLPGKEPEHYGYDLGGRNVLYQDGNLVAAGKAIMCKYDRCERIVFWKIGNFSGTIDTTSYPDSALDYLEGQLNTLLVSYTYDTLDTSQFSDVTGIVTASDRSANVHSLKTYEKIGILGDNYTVSGYVERWFYYDYRGRLIQTVEKYPDGSIHRISSKYDFADNVTASRETYTHGTTTETLDRTFSYDSRGRLLSETSTIGGVTASVGYSYDSVGRLTGKSYNGGTITETLACNIQGWQTAQTVKKGTEVLFDNTLKYYDGTTPLYSGNISEWAWAYNGQSANTYKFSYDKMSRLLGAEHFVGTTLSNKFTEKSITYDKNSNLTSMTRYVNGSPSTFTFAYTGNRRNGYIYDANGNITTDATNNLLVSSYNLLNLPTTIKQGSTVKATYTYLIDGTKIKTVNASGSGYDYIGSFKYSRSGSNILLESVATAGGRTYKTSGGYEARYFVTDHLGSTRLIASSNGSVVEQNDYMPYGERHSNSALAISGNPYLYNGKESQNSFGINYIDSFARMQRTDGQFNSIDLLCERHYHITPYTYCGGNPINTTDPWGLDFWTTTNSDTIKQLLNYFGSTGKIDTSGMTHFTDEEFLNSNPASNSYLRQSDNGNYYFTWKTSDQNGVYVYSYKFPTLNYNINSTAPFSFNYNTVGHIASNVGIAAGIGENLMFSKDFNTWMGKDWKIRSQDWGGNGITGGKFKYAAKIAKIFRWTGYGATIVNIANTEIMYQDSVITNQQRWIEHGSSAISLIPLYGTAWALGWEAGKLCAPLLEE